MLEESLQHVRPEFFKHIDPGIASDLESDAFEIGRYRSGVARVNVRDALSCRGSDPLGVSKSRVPRIGPSSDRLMQREGDAGLQGSCSAPEIAWILVQQRRQNSDTQHISDSGIRHCPDVSPTVSVPAIPQ